MRTCLMDLDSRAILDLTEGWPFPGYNTINRINVPTKSRGEGLASKLLRECCYEADKEKVILCLDVLASGGLSYEVLRRWYMRYGFIHEPHRPHCSLVRYPR